MINIITFLAWYNTNLPQNQSLDIYGVSAYAHQISNNVLFPMILLGIFFIILLGTIFSGNTFFRGLTFAGFACSVLSIILVLMNFLNRDYMYLCFLITGVGLLGLKLSESYS